MGGGNGLLAALALLVEKIRVLADPGHVPARSLNPVLSCGTVMATSQAEVFGVPNPVIGVVCFAVVTTVGAALAAGARFDRWFWLGLQTGVRCTRLRASVMALASTGLATIALAPLAYDLVPGRAGQVVATTQTVKMLAYVGAGPLLTAANWRALR